MKIGKSLEESGLLIKVVSETIKNEAKEQKYAFFGMLLDAIAARLLVSALAGKGVIRVIKVGEGKITAGEDF